MQLGLAHVCLLTPHMTLLRAKIDISVPRKRPGASGHDKAVLRFYDGTLFRLPLFCWQMS
jgi:protein pelota